MRIGYFDSSAGASGDMILGSLVDAGVDVGVLEEAAGCLGIGEFRFAVEQVRKSGIQATRVTLQETEPAEHRTYSDIKRLIREAGLSPRVAERALAAFALLAEAEGKIHGMPPDAVHFHEVGALDSIADVVGAFAGLEALGLDRLLCSPLALGRGEVTCEHGTFPVPAPATLEISRGLPVRGRDIQAELTTPTGAAVLRTAADAFGPIPSMTLEQVGYGAGSRDLGEVPNVLRLIVGEIVRRPSEPLTVIETNIDDMNPQIFSHLYSDLLGLGALDVWMSNILMKKGRPGFMVGALAEEEKVPAVVGAILRETTTAGVRLHQIERVKLPREFTSVATGYGEIRIKVFRLDGEERAVPEYDDCLRASREHSVPVATVMEEARNAYRQASRR
jgi:hypothetical protein